MSHKNINSTGKSQCLEVIRVYGVLFENRPAVYFCNYKENYKIDTRLLDTTN